MYAVLKTGGKQYRVTTDQIIQVEKLAGEAGEKVEFSEILMVGDKIGTPVVAGATVTGEILEQKRTRKIIVFKKKRRKNYRRKKGHRQHMTRVKITGITGA